MKNILLLVLGLSITTSCHRKELPSTKLRKEMRAANERSAKMGKKQLKKNKKAIHRKK